MKKPCNKPERVKLRNESGLILAALTEEEADSLERRGKARRISKFVYQLLPPPAAPSKSNPDPCGVVLADVYSVAGVYAMTPRREERLIGYGFLPALAK